MSRKSTRLWLKTARPLAGVRWAPRRYAQGSRSCRQSRRTWDDQPARHEREQPDWVQPIASYVAAHPSYSLPLPTSLGDRNHEETCSGCIVSLTTPTRWSFGVEGRRGQPRGGTDLLRPPGGRDSAGGGDRKPQVRL